MCYINLFKLLCEFYSVDSLFNSCFIFVLTCPVNSVVLDVLLLSDIHSQHRTARLNSTSSLTAVFAPPVLGEIKILTGSNVPSGFVDTYLVSVLGARGEWMRTCVNK